MIGTASSSNAGTNQGIHPVPSVHRFDGFVSDFREQVADGAPHVGVIPRRDSRRTSTSTIFVSRFHATAAHQLVAAHTRGPDARSQ